MFLVSSVADYVKRRRRGLLVAAGSLGGVWMLGRWAKSKVLELQEKSALERTAKENMRRRFEQNQQDCLFNVMALLPTIADHVFPALNVEQLTVRIKQSHGSNNGRSAGDGEEGDETATARRAPVDRKSKLELWEELRVASVTRVVTSLYLLALVTLLTHVQLNLLGRFYYVDSVVAFWHSPLFANESNGREVTDNSPKSPGGCGGRSATVSFDAQRHFLTFSWWLLNRGWRTCEERIRKALKSRIGSISLNHPCTFSDMEAILNDIRDAVEYEAPCGSGTENKSYFNMRSILLPDDPEDEELVIQQGGRVDGVPVVTDELSGLLDEARDFLDSSDFAVVRTACLDACFSVFLDRLHGQFLPGLRPSEPPPTKSDIAVVEKTLPFASLLPFFTREAQNIINGVPNDYLKRLEHMAELKAFSAVIYSSFDL